MTPMPKKRKKGDLSPGLRMKALVEATGLPKSTILYYLQQGLLPEPVRTSRNMAYYDPKCVDLVKFIQHMQHHHRLSLIEIKERLEEFGTSLDNICHMWYYIKGPEFPNGVEKDPKWLEAIRARDEFWVENGCPDLVSTKNPPPGTLLGIPSLALKDMLIEITVIAALPPLT